MKRIEQMRNSQGKVWLNVASSTHVLRDFINLDNHIFLYLVKVYPVIKAIAPIKYRRVIEEYINAGNSAILLKHDCRRRLPFPDQSVDHLLCSHFLEHVFLSEARTIVGDFFRVLKTGGTAHIVVPDLNSLVTKYITQNRDGVAGAANEFLTESLLVRNNPGTLKYRLLEFHGGFGLQHRYMYDYPSLRLLLEQTGFKLIDINETPSKNYRQDDGSVHVVVYKERSVS